MNTHRNKYKMAFTGALALTASLLVGGLIAKTAYMKSLGTIQEQSFNKLFYMELGIVCLLMAVLVAQLIFIFRPLAKRMGVKEGSLRKQLAETKKINSQLEEMSVVMGHDLKSPLRSIGSFAQLTKRRLKGYDDTDVKEYLEFITTGVNHMTGLLDSIMAHAKSTRPSDMKEEIVMDILLDEVKLNLYDSITTKSAHIHTYNLPTIQGSKFQLGQVMQNLIENGLKYNEHNKPEVRIEGMETKKEYIISVIDNGIGIPQKQAKRVFEVFQRLNPVKYEGSGVGLATCKKIIERHGGRIWVESNEAGGSTFRFTIPKANTQKKESIFKFLIPRAV